MQDLQPLSHCDIPKLMDLLANKFPSSCAVYNWLRMHSAWESKVPDIQMQVLCPGGDYRSQVVVALSSGLMGEDITCLTAYADEKQMEELAKLLRHTDLVPWSKIKYITKIMEPLAESIRQTLIDSNIKFHSTQNNFFYMSADTAIEKFQNLNRVTPDVRVGRLDASHVETIGRNWPYFHEHHRRVIPALVEHNCTVGVFVGDLLVMHALESATGCVTMVHTEPQYRNNGLATLGLKYLLRTMAIQGTHPQLFVDVQNEPSYHLFSNKLGFGKPITNQVFYFICNLD